MSPANHEETGSLMDALYLEMFDLMEQLAACRISTERLSNDGQLLLAKTRYLQGSQTVSIAQIPSENSESFQALYRVVDKPNCQKVAGIEYTVQRQLTNKNEGYVEPINWFGVLPPSSLRAAADRYRKCIDLVVESANLQRELLTVINNIEHIKEIVPSKATTMKDN